MWHFPSRTGFKNRQVEPFRLASGEKFPTAPNGLEITVGAYTNRSAPTAPIPGLAMVEMLGHAYIERIPPLYLPPAALRRRQNATLDVAVLRQDTAAQIPTQSVRLLTSFFDDGGR